MAKATTEAKGETAKKPKEPEIQYITSRTVADQLGIKPATLRRYLRSLPQFKDGNYTRYKWNPNDTGDMKNLANVKEGFAKFKTDESKKNADRLANLKKGAEGSTKTKAKKGKAEPDEEEEESEEPEEL